MTTDVMQLYAILLRSVLFSQSAFLPLGADKVEQVLLSRVSTRRDSNCMRIPHTSGLSGLNCLVRREGAASAI
jgi:hypothetical protein